MTQDYKNDLFKWLTGNYTTGSNPNIPQYSNIVEQESTLYADIEEQLEDTYTIRANTTIKDKNGNVQHIILYGNTTNNITPFFAVVNSNYELENIFTTYRGGTPLNFFNAIASDDDGYIYGLEYDQNGHYWLTLLNNFALQGSVILRRKYILPSNNYTKIIKDNNSGNYLCYNDRDGITAMTIKIEFGQPLQTQIYSISQSNNIYIEDAVAFWNEGNLETLKMIGFEWLGNSGVNYQPVLLYTTGSTTLTRQALGNSIKIYSGGFDAVIFNNQYAYFGYNDVSTVQGGNDTNYVYRVSLSDYTLEQFFARSHPSTYYEYGEDNGGIGLIKQGTNLYYEELVNGSSTWGMLHTYVGRIVGTSYYGKDMGLIQGTLFNVFNEYNFYKFNVLASAPFYYSYYTTQIYNPNNYNGLPYKALDSLEPNSCVLYSGGKPVFARNIYNKTISNNTTTSILEVPNLSLNDITIDQEDLLSVRNNQINSESMNLTKNIYEKLYINFINTISIINKNNIDNVVYNNIGATRLNNSVSEDLDYNNAKITKYRINYKNGTSSVNNFTIPTISGNSATYNFNVSTGSGINTIEFLSNDGSTVYHTIDCSNLANNKTYNIQQRVSVE